MDALFHPGRVLMTPGAMDLLQVAGHKPGEFLLRHLAGDWGVLCLQDRQANGRALKSGLRLLSVYPVSHGDTLYIITDAVDVEAGADPAVRESTLILLPEEY